jgi:cysteinyl-tRNA synthetase
MKNLVFFLALFSFSNPIIAENKEIDYRQKMRDLVISLSVEAKKNQPRFIIIPQNGQELSTDTGMFDGMPQLAYLRAIDATGRESMFYGYHADNEKTPEKESQFLRQLSLLNLRHGVSVLATDYCSSKLKIEDSYRTNQQNKFLSFAAIERHLNTIPRYPKKVHNENTADIRVISQAKNFLYLINSERYRTKKDFIKALSKTNYDVIIMDLFHNENAYTTSEIVQLKTKQNGGKRLVIAYMSIGEAEDYRYYWKKTWRTQKPPWLEAENPEWKGNYKVKYWHPDWQRIIFGDKKSYLTQIMSVKFDGVYLDIIDGFEYFEAKN